MSRHIKSSLVALFLLPVALPCAAMAGEASEPSGADWEGAYVGLGLGRTSVEDPHREYAAGTWVANGFTGLNSDGSNAVALTVGYNWKRGGLAFGVEAAVQKRSLQDAGFQSNSGVPDPNYTTAYDSDLSGQLSVRLGRFITEDSLLYANVGVVRTRYTRRYISSGGQDVLSGSERGVLLGVGLERMMGDYSIRGEVNAIRYGETTHTPAIAWSGLDDVHEATEVSVMLQLVRHF